MITKRDVFQIRTDLQRAASTWAEQEPLSKGHKGALIGHMNKAMGNDVRRQLCLHFLFKQSDGDQSIALMSTHELSEGQWHALRTWVNAWNDPDKDEWLADERFIEEAKVLADYVEVCYYGDTVVILDPMFDDYPDSVKEAMKLGAVIEKDRQEDQPTSRFYRFRKGKG